MGMGDDFTDTGTMSGESHHLQPTHHSLQAWAAMSDGVEHLLVLKRMVKMTNNDERGTINRFTCRDV